MRLFKRNMQKMREEKDVPGLIRALNDKSLETRNDAAQALGERADSRSVMPLIQSIKDADVNFLECLVRTTKEYEKLTQRMKERRTAGRLTHGKLQNNMAEYARLDAAVRDRQREAKQTVDTATAALVMIGAPAVDRLIEALKETKESFHGRQAIARALGEIGDPRAIEPLTELLNDPGPLVREAAAKALEKMRGSLTTA